jgi:hypothetical protein
MVADVWYMIKGLWKLSYYKYFFILLTSALKDNHVENGNPLTPLRLEDIPRTSVLTDTDHEIFTFFGALRYNFVILLSHQEDILFENKIMEDRLWVKKKRCMRKGLC